MNKYQVILADPPWVQPAEPLNLHIKKTQKRELPYSMMSIDDICNIKIKEVMGRDCVLFLWTTNRHIEDAYKVSRAWGFIPSTMLVWCKKPKGRGLGGTFGISTEYLLFSKKGKVNARERHWSTWFEAKRGKHSQKPELVRDIINKCFDGNKLELFARQKTEGWTCIGNDIDGMDIKESLDKLIAQ